MSNKIDFFGYEGKMTYENQNSGIRTNLILKTNK